MADRAPRGVITLMFTDIQDSTALWERLGDAFRPVLDRHHELVRALIARWDGYEVKSHGDSFMVAFARGSDALQCAVDMPRCFAHERWPEAVGELLVRIGLHTGEPFPGYDASDRPDYFGPMVNRAARVADAGHGGQIVISAATHDTAQDALTADMQVIDLGEHRLRGLDEPIIAPWLPHGGRIAFSPCGTFLVAAHNQSLSIVDTRTGETSHAMDGHTDGVECVAFTPDGRQLASGSWDGSARVWSAADGGLLAHLLPIQGKQMGPRGWLGVTPEGYYDATTDAAWLITCRIGNALYPAEA